MTHELRDRIAAAVRTSVIVGAMAAATDRVGRAAGAALRESVIIRSARGAVTRIRMREFGVFVVLVAVLNIFFLAATGALDAFACLGRVLIAVGGVSIFMRGGRTR